MRDTRQRWLVAMAVAVPLIVLSGCAGATAGEANGDTDGYDGALGTEQEESQLQALYEEAIDAGEYEVIAYGAPPPQEVLDAFESRFPDIEVTFEQLQSQDRLTRLQSEKASGNHVGDIVSSVVSSVKGLAMDDPSWCQKFDPIIDVPSDLIESDGQTVHTTRGVHGLIINTDLIDEADAPRTWEDLGDPEWKGKEVIVSPAAGGSAAFVMAYLLTPEPNEEQWGWDIVTGIQNNAVIVPKDAQVISSVVNGSYPIGLLAYYPYYLEMLKTSPDAPVKFLNIEEGVPFVAGGQCVLANAPHPHAAQLWLNWVMSKEGQSVFAAGGSYPVMPGSPGPEGLPAPDDMDWIPLLSGDDAVTGYVDEIRQVQELYGG